jgi:hypothetical protein
MQEKQRVADMAVEVLARQAEARAEWTGEPIDEAQVAVLETKAGQQLAGLRDGPHRDEEAKGWHDELAPPGTERYMVHLKCEECGTPMWYPVEGPIPT